MVILVEDLRLKFVLQNRGTLELCSFVLEGRSMEAWKERFSFFCEELEREIYIKGFKVAGSSNAISYKRMIYSFAIVFHRVCEVLSSLRVLTK